MVAGASTLAETSTFRTGSNPAILVLLGDRLRPVTCEDIRSIQATRAAAIKLLGKVGEPALPAFRELLAKAKAEDRHDLYEAILPLGDKAASLLPELQAYLLESRWWDEEEKLFAIFKNCGPAGARGLASVLKSLYEPKSPFLDAANDRARTVLKALGAIGPQTKDAAPVLIDLLQEQVALRPQVLEALGDIGPAAKGATPAVQALTSDPAVGPAARAALKRMGVIGKGN